MHLELNSTHLWALGLGFALGMLLLFYSLRNHWRTSREFKRYKHMLSDKMELEQRQLRDITHERDRLLKDNENLRVKVLQLGERPDNKLARDLEVYARAERQMKINAPGFAGAWELAKENANQQIAEEEKGNSLPQRIFRKLLRSGPAPAETPAPAKNGVSAENPA